jgi:hypothetical protein
LNNTIATKSSLCKDPSKELPCHVFAVSVVFSEEL